MKYFHAGHEIEHVHGVGCGHKEVIHNDHFDYLVNDHLHHTQDGHCFDHGEYHESHGQIMKDPIIRFISYEWIVPMDRDHLVLDEEAVAHAHLIWELQRDFGVNDEAIPIILNLINQLNSAVTLKSI